MRLPESSRGVPHCTDEPRRDASRQCNCGARRRRPDAHAADLAHLASVTLVGIGSAIGLLQFVICQ